MGVLLSLNNKTKILSTVPTTNQTPNKLKLSLLQEDAEDATDTCSPLAIGQVSCTETDPEVLVSRQQGHSPCPDGITKYLSVETVNLNSSH